MSSDPHVVWLEECDAERSALVGGKATGLGALLRQGFQVPPGFAITTSAYRQHVEHNSLAADLERLVADCSTYEAQQRASEEIRQLFESSDPTPELEAAVRDAHVRLCADSGTPVAVRSSANAEDTASASFAGQQETYLWILGGDEVMRHVLRCWSSLFTTQAIAYRAHLQTPVAELAMGVVVQQMVPAEAAGVMLTLDPVSGDRSGIVIEAAYGLGAAVVNGEVDPDRVFIDKSQLAIRSRSVGTKNVAYRFDPVTQGTRLEDVPAELQKRPCLTDEEFLRLATLGMHMEQAMGRSQDIEWAIGPGAEGQRELYLLQARPETVWSR
jgi:pyruvate,water dikinase